MRFRWRSELRVGLSPDRMVSVRYPRGLGYRVADRSIERFDIPSAAPAWSNTLDALSRLLRSDRTRDCDLVVVLSDHFARYATLPWTPTLAGESDWIAYARHTLVKTYGAQAAEWELRLCSLGRHKSRVACGIEPELIRAVCDAARETGARLRSIQPCLPAVFNRLRGEIARGDSWLALLEAGRLTLCVIGPLGLSAVRSRRTHRGALEELGGLLAREGLFREEGEPPKRLIIWADEPLIDGEAPTRGNVMLKDLTLARGRAPELRTYALALA